MTSAVDHPPHYQTDSGLEAIDVIEAFFPDNYHLGNVFKYLARAGKKDDAVQDLCKARWYLERAIGRLEADESRYTYNESDLIKYEVTIGPEDAA